MITEKYINWILLSMTGFFLMMQINKLSEIQKDLSSVQVKIAEIQTSIITRADIKEMIKYEILKSKGYKNYED